MGVKSFIKKSVAFVSALAMACSMVVMPAGASYAAETNDNLHLSKGITLQSDGNYKITLEAYSTGTDTTTTTEEAVPLDIVLVLDQSGSMSKSFGNTTRLKALKNAVTNFVSTVQADATKNDVNHRISMVGFASTKEKTGWFGSTYPNTEILTVTGNSAVNYKTASDKDTTFENALKNSLMDVRTQASKISQAINWLDASGDTYSEYGMDMASRILAKYPVQEGENRKQIIVMFTDGYTAPSGTNNIDYSMSDRAIANSKVAKDNGATVYTIGIFDGANPDMDINNNYQYGSRNSNRQLVAANRYMNLVSSNYPQAENMTTIGTKAEKSNYYQSASNATELNNIFESISNSETTSGTTVTLNSESVLRDIISDKFELPEYAEASSVSVYTADSKTVSADGKTITWDDRVEVQNPSVTISGNQVDVSGFDYSQNYVTASRPGKKLIVEILVNGLVSGENMESNDTEQVKSGIYENSSATTAVKNFVSPTVTIPEYSYVLDYGKKVTLPNKDKSYSETTQINSTKAAPSKTTSIKKTYGTFALENSTITYQPEKINWDGFDSIFNFGKKTDNSYEWSKVNVIPASSVYYEDDFGTANGNSEVAIVWSDGWTTDGTSDTDRTQSSENSVYGWETQYATDKGYSNGSAHQTSTKGARATFTFTGTGVDVYSRTNGAVGSIRAILYNGKTTENVNRISYIDNLSESGDYYQIPTLSFKDLDYETYTVEIAVMPTKKDDGTYRSTYYLDGIRVYNPIDPNKTKDTSTVEGKAYDEAKESNAKYIELRDGLISQGFGTVGEDNQDGAVFIDKVKDETDKESTDVGEFTDYGPKHEVYLNKNQGVAFKISNYDPDVNKVFIGIKSLEGKDGKVEVTYGTSKTEIDITSSNDLYYNIVPDSNGNVVIRNTTNSNEKVVLSVTKVRITGNNTANMKLTNNTSLMSYAAKFDTLSLKEDNSDDNNTDLDKDDVTIENPSEDENTNTNSHNTFWQKIVSAVNKTFGKR